MEGWEGDTRTSSDAKTSIEPCFVLQNQTFMFFFRILEGGGGGKRPGDDGDVRETRKKVKVDYTEEKVHFNNDRVVQVPIYKVPTKVYLSVDF